MQESILNKISSIQVIVFGNSSKAQAEEFCRNNIEQKFKVSHLNLKIPMHVGCLYTETSLFNKLSPSKSEAKFARKLTAFEYRAGTKGMMYWDCEAYG